jgi:CubicO group peptidase (beta-lactamase class C family)
VPLARFFPEWGKGPGAQVTLRHLMAQASGLVDVPGAPLFAAPDALAYARAQRPARAPGTRFEYSNVGITLLGAAVAQAAGQELGAFVDEQLLAPLGIRDAAWERDAAGHAMAPGGLALTPLDLLRIARLLRRRGTWQGAPLVPADWIALTTAPQRLVDNPCYGYLWWMIRDRCGGDAGGAGAPGPLLGFDADGYGGNYLAVLPASGVTGVRTKLPTSNDPAVARRTAFAAFPRQLARIAR